MRQLQYLVTANDYITQENIYENQEVLPPTPFAAH